MSGSGGGGGMVNILWDMVYFFFRVNWNYLLPALFYICRKCLFWISLVQLSIHSLALYKFVKGACKHLPSRATYTKSSRRHPELLQVAQPSAQRHLQKEERRNDDGQGKTINPTHPPRYIWTLHRTSVTENCLAP